jgi:hypothetical protein
MTIEAPRSKAARNLPMPGIVFYYSSTANPAQAGIALAVHFKILPQSREILKCKEFWFLFRVRSLIPQEIAGIALAVHFQGGEERR